VSETFLADACGNAQGAWQRVLVEAACTIHLGGLAELSMLVLMGMFRARISLSGSFLANFGGGSNETPIVLWSHCTCSTCCFAFLSIKYSKFFLFFYFMGNVVK
jgi:hypothetical protein